MKKRSNNDYQALCADLRHLAADLDKTATGYDRKRRAINRSKCFDGERQLHAGLAAGVRHAAQRVRALVPESAPEQSAEPEADA